MPSYFYAKRLENIQLYHDNVYGICWIRQYYYMHQCIFQTETETNTDTAIQNETLNKYNLSYSKKRHYHHMINLDINVHNWK